MLFILDCMDKISVLFHLNLNVLLAIALYMVFFCKVSKIIFSMVFILEIFMLIFYLLFFTYNLYVQINDALKFYNSKQQKVLQKKFSFLTL